MDSLPQSTWGRIPPSFLAANTSEDDDTIPDSGQHSLADLSYNSISTHPGLQFPFKDRQAARYLMFFIRDLASWIDICDPARHFATEVPKRMCHFPLLAYSLLAFSSRQLACMTGSNDTTCDAYYARALRILIPLLDDPVQSASENTLAGIVLLRLYEESSDSDTGTHLLGSTKFIALASSFATQGGLGEAASWVVLRQNLYVSLAMSTPLRLDLGHYASSSSLLGSGDESIANQAVLLCSEVVACTLLGDSPLLLDQWADLNSRLNQWDALTPEHFRPYYNDSSLTVVEGSDTAEPFPVILTTRPVHVIGYQHFYLARLLLKLFDPRCWFPSIKAFQERSNAEKLVLSDLRALLGLAINNPKVVTAALTAHHALVACGGLLNGPEERKATLQFLDTLSRRTGWKIHAVTEKLRRDWSNNSSSHNRI